MPSLEKGKGRDESAWMPWIFFWGSLGIFERIFGILRDFGKFGDEIVLTAWNFMG